MTDERTREQDPRVDPERAKDRPEDAPRPDSTDEEDPNPWTREGADAPDAADIEEPEEQR
jgi:hypothetical protein